MSDQKPETPQDADVTATLSTSSTQHLPAHGSAAWTTWVPASAHQPHPASSPTVAASAPTEPTLRLLLRQARRLSPRGSRRPASR